MTHKLEELFDLAPKINNDQPNIVENLPTVPDTLSALDALDKIEQALPAVRGLEASDKEMDELASKATESFDSLMDLGMQVDSRYASEIFAVAGAMLGHAITAKNAKLNKKLKMIELQLKKAKLDQHSDSDEKLPTAEGAVLDRNDLLKRLLEKNNANASKS